MLRLLFHVHVESKRSTVPSVLSIEMRLRGKNVIQAILRRTLTMTPSTLDFGEGKMLSILHILHFTLSTDEFIYVLLL